MERVQFTSNDPLSLYRFRSDYTPIPDEPCVGCIHRPRCAAEVLACERFYGYVIDVGGDHGIHRLWHNAPLKPSRAWYTHTYPNSEH